MARKPELTRTGLLRFLIDQAEARDLLDHIDAIWLRERINPGDDGEILDLVVAILDRIKEKTS